MKKLYISPGAFRIPAREIPTLMAVSDQSPDADAKSDQFSEEEDSWEEDNPWDRVDKPRDLWE